MIVDNIPRCGIYKTVGASWSIINCPITYSSTEMETFFIRNARKSDVQAIKRVHLDSTAKICGLSYDHDVVTPWAAAIKAGAVNYVQWLDSSEEFIVAESTADGRVLGFCRSGLPNRSVFPEEVEFEVQSLYVAPEAAGRGVGTALLTEIECRALNEGYAVLGLVSSTNAVTFYENFGYSVVAHGLYSPCGIEQKLEAKQMIKHSQQY